MLLREKRETIPNKGAGKLQKNIGLGQSQSWDHNDFRSFVYYFHVLDVNWGVRVCSNHRFIQLGTIWRMKVRGTWTYEKLYLTWFLMVTFVEVAVCFRVLLMTLCRILMWSTSMFYIKISINWKKRLTYFVDFKYNTNT